MCNFYITNEIVIRPIRNVENEILAVAEMQCTAYRRQFYDPKGTLGGALGKEFPLLEKYETTESFISTWRKLAKMVSSPNPTGYAYVAFMREDANNEVPVGIAKSMDWQAGSDLCENLTVYGKAQRIQDVAELGSVYVAPRMQDLGIGSRLVARVAADGLDKGFKQMVTRAYARNTSPKFFVEKALGKVMGSCRIPYGYDFDLLQAKGLQRNQMPDSIPGNWVFWNNQSMINIAQKAYAGAQSAWFPLNGRGCMRPVTVTQVPTP